MTEAHGRNLWRLWLCALALALPSAWNFLVLPSETHAKVELDLRPENQWQLKVAHAVDVLHEDVPELFLSYGGMGGRMPDFSIYSDDIEFVDERAPGFALHGLAMYKRFLSALRWSIRSMFEESKLEITARQRTLVNGQLSVRWRLHLHPKGLMNHALGLLAPTLKSWGFHRHEPLGHESSEPLVVEGYSNYEFDPWTGQVTRHSVDIKNPPLFIAHLLKQYSGEVAVAPLWPLRMETRLTGLPRSPARERGRALRAGESWPQSCEDDFECNGGRANFPLQCCELPLLGKFCCKPPDSDPSPEQDPAWVPLPVPSDPYSG